MKRQRWMICSFSFICLSLLIEAQESTQSRGDVRPADAPASTVLALNSASADGNSPELAGLPMSPQPMVVHQPVAKQVLKLESDWPSRSQIRLWKGFAVAEHSAAVFDAWSTRASLTSGNGYERDPLMKPFANSASIYPMLQIAPFGADYLGYRFMRSKHPVLRRFWWLPQLASISSSMWCGARNLQVADLKRR